MFSFRSRPRVSRCRPKVEGLEERVTPSVLGTFELDGNTTPGVLGTPPIGTLGSTTPSHDWDQVFADNNVTPPPASGALVSAFLTDTVNSVTDDSYLGGSSRDSVGIQQGPWLFDGSKPQGKDDIIHAFAAAYTDPDTGHLLVYAGVDRYDNSGQSTVGVWLFRNPVNENPDE